MRLGEFITLSCHPILAGWKRRERHSESQQVILSRKSFALRTYPPLSSLPTIPDCHRPGGFLDEQAKEQDPAVPYPDPDLPPVVGG